ncbi:S24 family peptidase [Acetobacterium tundrae]|uniref:Helix-turn-helix domain-containing protein n=1 Tax=Acetobacterium tundrae TaxID=132932 RepID=A0ABR6WLN9_9FIRM|nr:S24 family peptidase [Acetobacterium tundrae]MBC3797390.1 helix-turn-helix domain-containing protein [Acetobacterium tundrae]
MIIFIEISTIILYNKAEVKTMITEKIKTLKKQSKLTAHELSEKSGIPLPTIHKLLSGETKNPKYETLNAVVAALDYQLELAPQQNREQARYSEAEIRMMTLYRQLSTDGQALLYENLAQLLQYEKDRNLKKAAEPMRELPLYLLPASAGIGSYLDSDQYEFQSFFSGTTPAAAKYAVRVSGDSMEPAFYNGDIVFVEPTAHLNEGDVGIIVINSEGYIKQYRDQQFISFNPKYPPILPNEYDTVRIAGRVLSKYN